MRRLGYVEGQNLVVERRSALGHPERFPEIAAEVVHLNPDLILVGTNRVARAFRAATCTIPIVSASLSFPVEDGLAVSLARPGGNLTGITDDAGPEIAAKALEEDFSELAARYALCDCLWAARVRGGRRSGRVWG